MKLEFLYYISALRLQKITYLYIYLQKVSSYRDVRGFAIKFYSADGIWDLVGINIPILFIRDPMLLSLLAHAMKRNPVTNIKVRIVLKLKLKNTHFLKQTLFESPFLLFSFHRIRNDDYYYKRIY
jgi:hypothetical protein